MSTLVQTIKTVGKTFANYTERGAGITMRPYQNTPAKAILKSILKKQGHTIVIVMSRQAGKDELLANLVSYILTLFAHLEVGIVYVNPTYKPQTINAIMRLENRLRANLLTKAFWKKRSDFMRIVGQAVVSFLSGDDKANVVGATASLALIVNEAQDITPSKYDKDFAPMAASTNATRIIVGAMWTSHTLLAREIRAAREAEKKDGIKRVFIYDADIVGKVVPAYKAFVKSEIAKLGRDHPLIKTQYFCEEIDAQAGMFNTARRALMHGDRKSQTEPNPSELYVFTLDVAGQDEATMQGGEEAFLKNTARDSVTLTIHSVDLSELEILQAPIYRPVFRKSWTGTKHITIFSQISALFDIWNPMYLVIDSTGVGEGLWGMFDHKYPTKVIPFKFTPQSKSELGYSFLGIIETGRFRDCCPSPEIDTQYEACTSEVLIGPAKTMRWSVPEGLRDSNGNLIHDDWVISDALISVVDKLEWLIPVESEVIRPQDPLKGIERNFK
jgi:hypothetical protein